MRAGLTPAAPAGGAVGLLLLIVALAAGRADLAVTGALLLCAAGAALRARPSEPAGTVTAAPGPRRRDATGASVVPVETRAHAPGAEIVVLTATLLEHRTTWVAVAGPDAHFTVEAWTVHSGPAELVALQATAVGADGAWILHAGTAAVRVRIQPHARPVPYLPLPSAPSRLSGTHDAPRPGEGGEFRDVHPFSAGDRLQRIDWKATARLGRRPGDLFVRRTLSTSDVDVALIIDDADDVTGVLGDWARGDRSLQVPTSMDVAREAAWSLASGYLAAADQVSFQVLSRLGSAVPRGSGPRHRERLREAITSALPQPRVSRRRTPQLAPGALVVLLSTFLDDESVRLAGLWRAAGHRVIAVDTLPQLRSERLRRPEQLAARIVLGLREDRVRAIRAVGADVLVWDGGDGARTAALRVLSRRRRRR